MFSKQKTLTDGERDPDGSDEYRADAHEGTVVFFCFYIIYILFELSSLYIYIYVLLWMSLSNSIGHSSV
jgi:hypothetical protein